MLYDQQLLVHWEVGFPGGDVKKTTNNIPWTKQLIDCISLGADSVKKGQCKLNALLFHL